MDEQKLVKDGGEGDGEPNPGAEEWEDMGEVSDLKPGETRLKDGRIFSLRYGDKVLKDGRVLSREHTYDSMEQLQDAKDHWEELGKAEVYKSGSEERRKLVEENIAKDGRKFKKISGE